MRLDGVTAEIRPRSDWEAVDLGLALVRRDFWRCVAVWWLALGVPLLLAGWWLWDAPALLLLLFWWGKPAGSRMVLLLLSRRLFGEHPTWRAIWREVPQVWRRRFFYRFGWARLSPWLPLTLAVEDLEGLRGKAYAQRVGQVARRGSGAVAWTYLIAELAAGWFGLALFGLLVMLVPEGQAAPWAGALEQWDGNNPFDIPVLLVRTVAACVMVAMSLADVFLTGAGFGLYVNARTWIEGWDVELAFKRMAQRLGKVLGLLLLLGCWCLPAADRAAAAATAERPPQEVIQQVKAGKEFVVHKVRLRVPKHRGGASMIPFGGAIGWLLAMVLEVALVALIIGGVVWLIWKYRHLVLLGSGTAQPARAGAARVVMGLAVTPQSLPQDIPGMAWRLWQHGQRQEALGLPYRGAICRVIEHGRVEIHQADTSSGRPATRAGRGSIRGSPRNASHATMILRWPHWRSGARRRWGMRCGWCRQPS
jgi:hypothetical protein